MRRFLTTLVAGTLLALPIATPAMASAAERPACADRLDNDGDGYADFGGPAGDPACTSALDGDEADGAVLALESAPDAAVEGRPPAITFVRHTVTVRNDGLVPETVTLVQDHAFTGSFPIIGGLSAPSTTQGSCAHTGADVACDLGMVLPGQSVTVETTLSAVCVPIPFAPPPFGAVVSTWVRGSPMRAGAAVDSNTATTTYHVTCLPLGGGPTPPPLPF